MGRALHRLSARAVANTSAPGYYADGGGLYLQVARGGSKSWIFRFKRAGRVRDMGLGSVSIVTLAEARTQAVECRRQLSAGIDPIEARKRARVEQGCTFDVCVSEFIATNRAQWKNEKHIAQWENTLATYASPHIGATPVDRIDVQRILSVLTPIWTTKTETATRVRQRIENVIDYAIAKGYRADRSNPAHWRGNLQQLLPKPERVARVQHHAAIHYDELPAFMAELVREPGIAALALRWTILTCARTGETRGATPDEIDRDRAVWTIPGARMKARRDHVVPLTDHALAILELAPSGHYLFAYRKKPLSENAMLVLLERMGRKGITVHGFRSTFKDWATECTQHPTDAIEIALAHNVGDATERAYRRGDMLAKRRALADDWAAYCMRDL